MGVGARLPSPRPTFGAATLGPLAERSRVAVAGLALFVVLLGAETVRSPHRVVELVAAVLLAALVFWRLLAGVVLFTVVTFPAHLPGSLGAGGATFAKPLGALLVLAWILALVRDRETPSFFRDQPLVSAALVGYLLWGLLSALWAQDAGRATSSAIRLAQVVILFFVVYSTVSTLRHARIVAVAYVAAAGLTSAYVLASGRTFEGRLTGGLDPNFLAAELVPALIVGGFLFGTTHRLAHRLLLIGTLATVFVTFALTQSRGGAIALAAALFVAVVVAGPVRPVVIATVVASLGLAATYYAIIAPAAVRERVTQISASSSSGRSDTWQIAAEIAGQHLVGGVGLGNFPVVEPNYLPTTLNLTDVRQILRVELVVHNTFLETLAELGVVGLVLLLVPIAAVLAHAVTGIRGRADGTLVARGLIAGVSGLLVGYIFLSAEYEKQLWLLLALVAACARIAHRERSSVRRPVRTPAAPIR